MAEYSFHLHASYSFLVLIMKAAPCCQHNILTRVQRIFSYSEV